MIKQKKEYDKWKKKEGDSDLVFNEKDNKKKDKNQKSKCNILKFRNNIVNL